MKKLLVLCIAVVLSMTLFVGCGEDNNSSQSNTTQSTTAESKSSESDISATIKTDKSQYDSNVDVINITVDNNSDRKIYFGEEYNLEKKSGDSWNKVEKTSVVNSDVLNFADSKDTVTAKFDIANQYGNLDSGEYRVVVLVSDVEDNFDNAVSLYGEFTVK